MMTAKGITTVNGVFLAVVLLALPGLAVAQSFPSKSIRMIVPYPPGVVDAGIRVMAPKMGELLGQPLVIDNRGGANGTIGSDLAARAEPDGHTLLFATSSTIVGAPVLMKGVTFDPVADFTPISHLYDNLRVITVHASLPAKSLKELIDYARRNPGKLSYGSSGIGSAFHLDGEILKTAANMNIVHVPYKGTGPMLTDLAAGRVEVGVGSISSIEQHVKSGKLRVVAFMEPKRNPKYPDVPTVAEVLPGTVKAPSWIGLLAPAGVPQAVVMRVRDAALKAMETPEAKTYFDKTGAAVIGSRPEDLAAAIKDGLARMKQLASQLGLQPK